MNKTETYQADAKKKARSNVIDEIAINITKQILPNHWTIRDYKPDYGIDLAIETFDDNTYETLGEHFFVQVKGQENVKKGKVKIKGKDKSYEMDVIKFSLETDLLVTVQRMGHGCPVMLFVVDINDKSIYFVNLNDYIDKVFLENNKDFIHQKKVTINIPIVNKIVNEQDAENLYFFSKRAKFYSFFETSNSQNSNFLYIYNFENYKKTAINYAKQLLTFDIISSKYSEKYFKIIKNKLIDISNGFVDFLNTNNSDNKKKEWEIPPFEGLYTRLEGDIIMYIQSVWDKLITIQGMHEDCWRKTYLPTDFFAMLQETEKD